MRSIRRGAVALGATLVVLVMSTAHARIDPTCGRNPAGGPGRPIGATLSSGQVTVVTQGGSLAAFTPSGQQVMISTTGTIDVVVDYECMMDMVLTVTPTAPPGPSQSYPLSDTDLNGAPQPAGTPGICVKSSITVPVNVGFNVGQYQFTLSGTGCNGVPANPTTGGGLVGDPPLPL